jgi:hypothetical protein
MKKLYLFCLFLMLSIGQVANGEGNRNATENVDEEEKEIDNFDFLYEGNPNFDEAFSRTSILMDEAFSHLGKRYRSGAKGPKAFDCSGFTSYVYKQFSDVFIGASSRDQYASNIPISRSEIRCGDLVFFTSPHSGRNVGHVGIVVDFDPVTQDFTFIHASSYSGVKLSSSTESVYVKRYIGARRVRL